MYRRLLVSGLLRFCTAVFLTFLSGTTVAAQQGPPPASSEQRLPDAPKAQVPLEHQPVPSFGEASHRFWDRKNRWLFAGVAVARALDYHSTGNMRRRGREEILLTNEVVDNKPAFAAVEAAGALASVGVSYLFHRTGHHRLERWTSYVHIGIGLGGAIRNYSLKSHPVSASP